MTGELQAYSLPEVPAVSGDVLGAVRCDYERYARDGLPRLMEDVLADRYRLDVRTQYAGYDLKNPWGKASGQLSMTARQVEEDVAAGLGFIVLKTVIAEDEAGSQSMHAWAVKESRMAAVPVVGKSGEAGWTVSWKGRGWWQSFDDYLDLVRDAQRIAAGSGTLIVPSCKYHLPTPEQDSWNVSEYRHTTSRLLQAWRDAGESSSLPMPLEKDFSPTLAGSDRATARAKILEWLRTVPELVAEASGNTGPPSGRCPCLRPPVSSADRQKTPGLRLRAKPPMAAGSSLDDNEDSPSGSPVRLGLKIFNALFDDDFQLEMLAAIHKPGPGRPEFYVYANRLFDPNREFDGLRGIAYGGPDLSDRNLRVMRRFAERCRQGEIDEPLLDWSATGNITTGKRALEYALQGAGSFQLHTFFQLPADQYAMKSGSKIEKALCELYFHPVTGLIVWLHHLAGALGLSGELIRFRDVIGRASVLPE